MTSEARSGERGAERGGGRPPRLFLHTDRPEVLEPIVRERFPDADIVCCQTYAALAESLARHRPEIVFTHKFEAGRYPGRTVVDAPSVKWIHVAGTGFDHLRPWPADRVTVTNSAGTPGPAMAEFVMGAIYALNQNRPRYFGDQADRVWRPGTIRLTRGSTMVVVGLGRIGRAIAASARANGLRVLAVRTRAEPETEADEVFASAQMSEALARADVVVVVLPLTEATTGLVGRTEIAAIRPGALLVNVSRGGVVDEGALVDALRAGHLRGAALDVFAQEPLPADSPFWELENVLVTPHVAGHFVGWEAAATAIFCDNVERWLAGRDLVNRIDPARAY